MRGSIVNGLDHRPSNLLGVNSLILGMGSQKANEDQKKRCILDLGNQTVRVALDVEDHSIAGEKVRRPEGSTDVLRSQPGRPLDNREPQPERPFGVGMLFPELNQRAPVENTQPEDASMLPGWEQ